MSYTPPIQTRAIESEKRFLSALEKLLHIQSLSKTTITEIAEEAGLTKSAFLKRFGSKEEALQVLYQRYCDCAEQEMAQAIIDLPQFTNLKHCLEAISARFEELLRAHYPANRGMHELLQINFEIHQETKRIFRHCVEMMQQIQQHYLPIQQYSDAGAFAGAQLLVTVCYNYVLGAMPGLPQSCEQRHQLVAEIVGISLQR